MSDTTATHRFVRCPVELRDGTPCGTIVRNRPEDRADHLRGHDRDDRLDTIEERIGQISQSLRFLGKEIDGIRGDLAKGIPTGTPDDDVTEWPEEDFDTDTDELGEAPEPGPFAALTTNAPTPVEDDDIDDLETRIANLGTTGPTA